MNEETILENNSYKVLMNWEKQMIIIAWNEQTLYWTGEDYKKENLHIVQAVAQCKSKYLLSLSRNFLYTINPEEQLWLVDNVFTSHYQNGVRKMALVMSEDIISQLSIEQLIDETNIIASGMFAEEEEAEAWLLAN